MRSVLRISGMSYSPGVPVSHTGPLPVLSGEKETIFKSPGLKGPTTSGFFSKGPIAHLHGTQTFERMCHTCVSASQSPDDVTKPRFALLLSARTQSRDARSGALPRHSQEQS